jgi:hypothetical protein
MSNGVVVRSFSAVCIVPVASVSRPIFDKSSALVLKVMKFACPTPGWEMESSAHLSPCSRCVFLSRQNLAAR